jgi:hypothetical protein
MRGETSDMHRHEAAMQRGEAQQRETVDPWYEVLSEKLVSVDEVWVTDIYGLLYLDLKMERVGRAQSTRAGEVMRKLGFKQVPKRDGSTVRKCWRRTAT